jgi:ubiquinone/menaquinone biosynthesis C-methylase UbiE
MQSSCAFPETADIETSSEDYARRFSGAIGKWLLNVQAETTLRMLAPYPGSRILDVGGGHGQLTETLARNDYAVTVLGSAESCKGRIQKLLDENRCCFQVGNILALPYPDRAFDVVISYRLLAHVRQWKKLLRELSRVAKTAVLIDYPAIHSINFIAPQLFRFKKCLEGNTRPFLAFKESELVDVFSDQGFFPTDRYAQFFVPMVVHRILKRPRLSSAIEGIFRVSGATEVLGSPGILKLSRKAG